MLHNMDFVNLFSDDDLELASIYTINSSKITIISVATDSLAINFLNYLFVTEEACNRHNELVNYLLQCARHYN